MPKIDKMLQMMQERGVERAVLRSDKPFQLYIGHKAADGSITPAEQLMEVVHEITPPTYLPLLQDGGTFHLRHPSPYGDFDIGVESFLGTLSVNVAPAREPHPTSSPSVPPTSLAGDSGPPNSALVPTANTTAIAVQGNSAQSTLTQPMAAVCVLHSDRAAAGVCSHSGKFYCSEDLIEISGRLYGKENLPHVVAANSAPIGSPIPTVVINNAPVYGSGQIGVAPLSPAKSRATAGLLGLLLPGLGIHRFYLGYTAIGLLQILVTIVTCGWGSIWGFVEGIIILCGGMNDSDGRPLV